MCSKFLLAESRGVLWQLYVIDDNEGKGNELSRICLGTRSQLFNYSDKDIDM